MKTVESKYYKLLKSEPKQRRSRELIDKICGATLRILREEGVQELNTNLIAASADVEATSLYRFFDNKESIVLFIANIWLLEIKETWDHFETDPSLLALNWRDYFETLSASWWTRETDDLYKGLAECWNYFPELKEADDEHQEYWVQFFIRQMMRFEAKGDQREWRDLALYLYLIEDNVFSESAQNRFSCLESARQLFLETMDYQIGRLMPSPSSGRDD